MQVHMIMLRRKISQKQLSWIRKIRENSENCTLEIKWLYGTLCCYFDHCNIINDMILMERQDSTCYDNKRTICHIAQWEESKKAIISKAVSGTMNIKFYSVIIMVMGHNEYNKINYMAKYQVCSTNKKLQYLIN